MQPFGAIKESFDINCRAHPIHFACLNADLTFICRAWVLYNRGSRNRVMYV